jgi:hypothetical protein
MHTQLAEHKEWDEEKKRDRDGPTSTPGNGLPTYPGLRSPLSGLEITSQTAEQPHQRVSFPLKTEPSQHPKLRIMYF